MRRKEAKGETRYVKKEEKMLDGKGKTRLK
jgi:hypothetical protein